MTHGEITLTDDISKHINRENALQLKLVGSEVDNPKQWEHQTNAKVVVTKEKHLINTKTLFTIIFMVEWITWLTLRIVYFKISMCSLD